MKKNISLLYIIITLISCNKENNDSDESNSSSFFSNSIDLIFKNQDGEDLLNDSTDNYLSEPQLYFFINGEKIKAQDYDPQIGSETGTYLITESDPYELRCFLYDGQENVLHDSDGIQTGINTNYLEFNGEINDTITTQWEHVDDNGSFYITKVWINGELRTEVGDVFIIEK